MIKKLSLSYYEMLKRSRFKLAKQVDRVNSRWIKLSEAEEQRFDSLMEKLIKVSLHDHTVVFPEDPDQFIEFARSGDWVIGVEGLARSRLDAVFEGMDDGTCLARSPDPWSWDNVIYQLGLINYYVSKIEEIFIGLSADDIVKAHNDDKLAMFIHLEGAPHMGEEIDLLRILYGLGVRCMGVVYSVGNEYASGLADDKDYGLTPLGARLIDAMNEIGIVIDLAHANDKTCLETMEISNKPVLITHAGARSVWPTRRMKPDEVLTALADNGGVIGIEAAPHTTISERHLSHSIESIMDHFIYIEELIGIDHLAFGPDTLFGDHVALHKVFHEYLSIQKSKETDIEYPHVDFVDGLENPSQYPNIIRWLIKHGYSDTEIEKITFKNIYRVLKRSIG